MTSAAIDAAPAITFLWRYTFPLKIYGPLVLPLLIVFIITSIETVGDVTATEEASFVSTTGPSHEKRVRGALLNDGLGGIFSALVRAGMCCDASMRALAILGQACILSSLHRDEQIPNTDSPPPPHPARRPPACRSPPLPRTTASSP